MTRFITYTTRHYDKLIQAVLEHFEIVGLTLVISIALAFMIAMLVMEHKRITAWITRVFSLIYAIPSLAPVFGKLDFKNVFSLEFVVVVFAFLFVDLFDTLGTLIGVSTKAGMLDKDGKLPRIKGALMADAVATTVGAVLGTSTTTTFVESSSGVAEGGRTGLSSVVTGFLFLIAIIFAPVFTTIPGFATAPALIFVGFLMVSAVVEIDFNDLTESIPAYLCLICMPLMYSISEGIAVGVISYVIVNLVAGKAKKITPLMYVLALLFILKYIFL